MAARTGAAVAATGVTGIVGHWSCSWMYRLMCRLLCCLSLLLFALPSSAAPEDFPIPASIRPAVDFWKKVYTEVDTGHGYLHDAVDLRIIYTTLPRDNTQIEQHRQRIVADLKVLASGERRGLSERQQTLLALWGENTSNARFAQASKAVRWQLGQSDRFLAGLIRSGAYRGHIEAVIREKGLPLELVALPHVESSFHPGAYSSVAASGMWQFMRETAQRFMRVDHIVDERLDPYRATYAAMDLLQGDYQALGSWPLALTAYNHGAYGIARAMRAIDSEDIGRIITEYKGPRFGFASRNFYPSFLAAVEVDRQAQYYFGDITMDRQPDFATVAAPAFLDAATLARILGVSLDDLRRTNPALQAVIWNGSKRIPKGYPIKVDRAVFQGDLAIALDALPVQQYFAEQIADVSYTVRSGDSLSVIARRYNTSVAELTTINQLRDRHAIRIGQQLILPRANGAVPSLVVNDTRDSTIALPASGEYTVRSGDTIANIAQRFQLLPERLLYLNNLSDEGLIFPDQVLRLTDTPPVANDAAAALASADRVLATDPGDYGVAADDSIEILTDETLGHYADWLELGTAQLRQLNGLGRATALRVGKRLRLDFSQVSHDQFEARRKQYHSNLQAQYFTSYRIRDTESYSIKRSEVLAQLARERSVPLWLLRQYNPEIGDTSAIQIGQVVVFPVVEAVEN